MSYVVIGIIWTIVSIWFMGVLNGRAGNVVAWSCFVPDFLKPIISDIAKP
jgi:hypothetical protein